jgi:ribosomal protein L4
MGQNTHFWNLETVIPFWDTPSAARTGMLAQIKGKCCDQQRLYVGVGGSAAFPSRTARRSSVGVEHKVKALSMATLVLQTFIQRQVAGADYRTPQRP